jgi:murein DD-endopeptidase MepM/ murein hydrolase activator NlpD
MYEIDEAIAAAEKDEARTKGDLETIESRLSGRVVDIYKNESSGFAHFLEALLEERDFLRVINRWRQLSRVAEQDNEVFDEVGRHLQKVNALEENLAQKRAEQKQALGELQSAQKQMEARLQATAAEYKRLKRQVAAMEEAARKAAEARRLAARNASNTSGRGSSSTSGRVVKGFVFPVDGPHSYINDWGFPRSGGRSHRGTDIMAPMGTPCVAVVSGTVSRTAYNRGLGGTTIWLRGNDGNSYYYAHLNGIASGVGGGTRVSAGQVIGYVGNSGNARGGAPHLHFEIHPGGGGAINPYFTLRAAD